MGFLARHVPPGFADRLERSQKRLAAISAKAREQTELAVTTLEASATGLALGFVEGYWGRTHVMGAPISPVVGVAAVGFGLAMGGAEASHLHAIGTGALAVYGYKFGHEVGKDRRAKAGQQPATTTSTGFYPAAYAPPAQV